MHPMVSLPHGMEDPLIEALSKNGDDLIAGLKTIARSEICVILTDGVIVGLNLDGSKITDAGLSKLITLKEMRWIGLARSEVTDAGVKKLRKALPDCNVLY
ncbi:MAG: hypothetical protein QF685_02230 [Verrucomicrobiota bacterium]|jgi:hypothetical protein|nr:hypothetical protein [Verrucomicrobiota bacterium]